MLTFLAEFRHHEVEDMMIAIKQNWPEVGVIVVHPKDPQAPKLAKNFAVTGDI